LFEGRRVLIDATFRQERQRWAFLDAARRWCVPAGFLSCSAPADVVQKRLQERRHDVSDANWSVYLTAAKSWDEPSASTRDWMRILDTTATWKEVIERALNVLVEFGIRNPEI
jgi:predicted kinase